jgi:hypothetical protein
MTMSMHPVLRRLAFFTALLHLLLVVQIPVANAAMIGTHEVLAEQQHQVDQAQLMAMLDDEQVKDKLVAMGVEREQVESRIASLTPAELAQFNQQLDQAPAGGVVGIIVLFLVIFIITDMLCATNIFNFVKCINR